MKKKVLWGIMELTGLYKRKCSDPKASVLRMRAELPVNGYDGGKNVSDVDSDIRKEQRETKV